MISNIKIPKNYKVDDQGQLFYEDKCVSIGFAIVEKYIIVKKISGKEVGFIKVKFYFHNSEYLQEYSIEEFEKTKFHEVPALFLEHPRSVSLELFKQFIRYQIVWMKPIVSYEISHLGYAMINGKRVYCFGNKVLGATDLDIRIADEIKGYELQYHRVDAHALARGLDKFLNVNPAVSLAMISYLVLGLSRQVFFDADVPVKFVMFVVGEQQSFKTTLASLFFNLYNRQDNIETHLQNYSSSTPKLVQVLDQFKDTTLVFDDMNESNSSSVKRRQEEAVASLIQMAANNIGKKTTRNAYKVAGQLVFCGEYMLTNPSTVNRTILLQFTQDMFDCRKVEELEAYADTIPQFAEEYVSWILKNYDSVKEYIRQRYGIFMNELSENNTDQKRIVTSANILRIAFELFMNFCEYQGWQNLLTYKDVFSLHLTNLICKQVDVYQLAQKEKPDICCELYFSIHERYFNDLPEKAPKKNFVPPVYYDERNELVYIRGEAATEFIHLRTGEIVPYLEIFREFDKLNLLISYRSKDKSRSINAPKTKHRYYCIRYMDWREYVKGQSMGNEEF